MMNNNDVDLHSFIEIGTEQDNRDNRDNENTKLKYNEIINPYFVGTSYGTQLSMRDVYQNYKYVYVICFKDDVKENVDIMTIFLKIVDKNELKTVCSKFTLIKTNINILKNNRFKKKANVVAGTLLNEHFGNNVNMFNNSEIIIPMFELAERNARLYIEMIGGSNLLENLDVILTLESYYNRDYNDHIKFKMTELLSNLDSSNYWRNSKNCNFNINDIFGRRDIPYDGVQSNIVGSVSTQRTRSANNTYDIDSDAEYKKCGHMNIYEALKKSKSRTFYATANNNLCMTKDSFADMFDKITNEKYRYDILDSLLRSKDYCHLVLNNKRILERSADIFEKYKPFFANRIGYAMLTFYLEECIISTKTTKNHRYVFDIDTVGALPKFPFSMENIHHSPYVPLLLDRALINPETNFMSLNALENYDKYYGVCTKDEAYRRLNVFVSGRHDMNIFEGIDQNIFSISGSVITACILKQNPLFDKYDVLDISYDDKWNMYFDEYYDTSDIDVMCRTNSTIDFICHVSEFSKKICEKLQCDQNILNIIPIKSTAVIVSKHFFEECVDDLNNEIGLNLTKEELTRIFKKNDKKRHNDDVDKNGYNDVVKNAIVQYFHVDYCNEKNKRNALLRKALDKSDNNTIDNKLLLGYITHSDVSDIKIKMTSYDFTKDDLTKKDNEFYYYVNDFRNDNNKVSADKNFMVFKFSESIKYKIKSNMIKRPIEIFKIDSKDPFNCVSRFHLPNVRAYFQHNNVYMLPSFVSSMMTMICVDYKYFASSQNPCDILNKNRKRCFSIILNLTENLKVYAHNKKIDGIGNDDRFKVSNENEYFGLKSLDNKIYKSRDTVVNNDSVKYINNINELKNVYKTKYNYDEDKSPIKMLDITHIKKDGTIAPVKSWLGDAFYEYMNS